MQAMSLFVGDTIFEVPCTAILSHTRDKGSQAYIDFLPASGALSADQIELHASKRSSRDRRRGDVD